MENKTGSIETRILAGGIFKKRMWPWLFVLLAAILAIASYVQVAIEFFGEDSLCPYCPDYFTYYFYHHNQWLIATFIIVCALIVLAALCAIIFIRKRTLVITTNAILFKKGARIIQIPLSTIEDIDTGAHSLLVTVPFKKFRFAKLENKKEIYDILLNQLTAPAATVDSSSTLGYSELNNDNYYMN